MERAVYETRLELKLIDDSSRANEIITIVTAVQLRSCVCYISNDLA